MMRDQFIAVVPAAGEARRLPPELRPKELLTIGNSITARGAKPKAVSEYLVDALSTAGIRQICLVISPLKQDIAEFYASGARHGVQITYACQQTAAGMAHAVDAAHPLLVDRTVVMGMPDTLFKPFDAVLQLKRFFEREPIDLALGVFPTTEADRLGPVRFDGAGHVAEILDKPQVPPVNNTWGLACWGPAFTQFLHDDLAAWSRERGERPLGSVFHAALEHGLHVRALSFRDGMYIDVGTLTGLCAARRAAEDWSTEARRC